MIAKRPPPYVPPQLRTFSNVSPPTADTNFQLVVVSPGLMAATYGHGPFPLSHNFVDIINSTTKLATRHHPTHSTRATRPPQLTLRFPCRISIDCCVLICKMAATLRRRHLPSPIYFLTPLISPLQASEPTTVYTIPTACGLRMALGISGVMI
jgi:hypothetical protein